MRVSVKNNTTSPLASLATFTGGWENVDGSHGVAVSAKTDQDGTLYIEFSPDGVNADGSLSFAVSASLNEVHRLTTTRKYFRARFTNTSASAQTFFRLQSLFGDFSILTSALNSSIQQDADAIISRTIDSEIAIAAGLFTGYSITNKFGTNGDVDSGTVPEDVWDVGGTYTGWAAAAEAVQVLSSSASDASAGTGARTISITGLDANYAIQTETITLNGVTPVSGALSFIRVHTASIVTAGSGGVNAGTITIRQAVTTANVFASIVIGRNQSNVSAYTVPAGYTAYMRKLHSACGNAASVSLEGGIWTRAFGGVFRLRRPFFVGDAFLLHDDIYGGLRFTEKSDLIIRITSCSVNNTPINAGYDLLLVKN